MGERYLDPASLTPTHELLKGARIRVELKTKPHVYAWATVMSELTQLAKIPKEFITDKYPGMVLYLSMGAFTVQFPQHDYRQVTYDPYWRLFGFRDPEDKLVRPIPKPPKQLSML